jgi:hypothetical protein
MCKTSGTRKIRETSTTVADDAGLFTVKGQNKKSGKQYT